MLFLNHLTKLYSVKKIKPLNILYITMSKINQKSNKSYNNSKKVQNASKLSVTFKQQIPLSSNQVVEQLASPIKSENDKKDYKVIRLANGLTACLISDTLNWKPMKDVYTEEYDIDSDEESIYSDKGNEDLELEDDELLEGEDIKMRKSLPDIEEKMASAALCIGVGSFSDPKEVPGMAHFLEHMVFMGSEKFPQENDFDAFIKKRGGSDNASTDCETTTFYFECLEKHLYRGLDKFAQFFISPLMKREAMTREREAIDSEFQMALPSDAYRREQLLCSFANPKAPVNTFTWGNLVTLRDNVSDDDLYNGVHEFRKRHYSAHRMTLAIQARLPMEQLENYVSKCFAEVPNNNLLPDNFKPFANGVFNTPAFKCLYYLKPMKDICQVDLTWALPSLLEMYKSKPHQYVAWILGHEGKGSLLAALRHKVWALSIFTGNGETGLEHNTMYSLFTITLVLTKDGLEHLAEVIEMVFSYMQLMRDKGPQESLFKEIQLIDETSFRFAEEESAVETVEDLAEAMQFYPPEDYIAGSELYYEFNPQAIEMVMNHLTPCDLNIMVLSTALPKGIEYDKKEPWFGTEYAQKEIPSEWKNNWERAKPLQCFHLPEPNIFLTSNFDLLPPPKKITEYPEKIISNNLVELWYRQDTKFKLPIAYYYFYFNTLLSLQSPTSACLMDMYVGLLSLMLNEEAYPAHVAELSYSITVADKGFILKIDGYNEKLPLLISLITKYICDFESMLCEGMFEAYKDKLTKHYYNNFLKPARLAKDVRMGILLNIFWSPLDKHSVVTNITYNDIKRYSRKLMEQLYIQVLIQGNVSKEVAINTTEQLIKGTNCSAITSNSIPKIRVAKLPKGEHCCLVKSFNANDANSIITNYYQSGPSTFRTSVIIELLMMLLEEPLFDILRTKEQLGYNVFCTNRDTFGILGYSITINTQASKNSTFHCDERIENFVKRSMNILRKTPHKKFNQMKNDLVQIKQLADVHLKDEVSRNWGEISMQEYIFDRLKQEIRASESILINDLRNWWDEHNSLGKQTNFRKLSIQIVGHAAVDKSKIDETLSIMSGKSGPRHSIKNNEESSTGANASGQYSLKLLSHAKGTVQEQSIKDYYITNMSTFKQNLELYPDKPS